MRPAFSCAARIVCAAQNERATNPRPKPTTMATSATTASTTGSFMYSSASHPAPTGRTNAGSLGRIPLAARPSRWAAEQPLCRCPRPQARQPGRWCGDRTVRSGWEAYARLEILVKPCARLRGGSDPDGDRAVYRRRIGVARAEKEGAVMDQSGVEGADAGLSRVRAAGDVAQRPGDCVVLGRAVRPGVRLRCHSLAEVALYLDPVEPIQRGLAAGDVAAGDQHLVVLNPGMPRVQF